MKTQIIKNYNKMESKTENKIEVEKRRITIYNIVMIVLMLVAISLIQWSISDNADQRIKEQTASAVKEAKEQANKDILLNAGNRIETKVTTLTDEVHGYRNDVTKNTQVHEKSLKNFNELKNQNEKVYIPNATVEQQTDFISSYKYEPIGTN